MILSHALALSLVSHPACFVRNAMWLSLLLYLYLILCDHPAPLPYSQLTIHINYQSLISRRCLHQSGEYFTPRKAISSEHDVLLQIEYYLDPLVVCFDFQLVKRHQDDKKKPKEEDPRSSTLFPQRRRTTNNTNDSDQQQQQQQQQQVVPQHPPTTQQQLDLAKVILQTNPPPILVQNQTDGTWMLQNRP